MSKIENFISNWKPVSELKTIEKDISSFGYNKEFVDKYKLNEKKKSNSHSFISGKTCFEEYLEVKQKNGEFYYRENGNLTFMEIPTLFETQFGAFKNHNNGEFFSWLGRDDYNNLSYKDKEMHQFSSLNDFYIEGNFCDMFDCGNYSYAISNLLHMGLGNFKIVRIDEKLKNDVIFDNNCFGGWSPFEYVGRYKNEIGYILVFSGLIQIESKKHQERIIFYQIDTKGNYKIKAFDFIIPHTRSIATLGDIVLFGHNKMVTRVNVSTGELTYLTNKNEEELAELSEML